MVKLECFLFLVLCIFFNIRDSRFYFICRLLLVGYGCLKNSVKKDFEVVFKFSVK